MRHVCEILRKQHKVRLCHMTLLSRSVMSEMQPQVPAIWWDRPELGQRDGACHLPLGTVLIDAAPWGSTLLRMNVAISTPS